MAGELEKILEPGQPVKILNFCSHIFTFVYWSAFCNIRGAVGQERPDRIEPVITESEILLQKELKMLSCLITSVIFAFLP